MEPQTEPKQSGTRVALWLVVLAVIIAGWFALSVPKAEQETIKIGVIAPLTGSFAVFGERIRNGIELARSDLDMENQVTVVYEDACQPKDAVSAVHKLIQFDSVAWIGGSFCLVGFVPIIPIVEENKKIAFNTAANPDAVLGHQYIFSTNKSIRADAQILAQFARNKLGAKTAASLFYITPLGEDYGKYFNQYFEDLGGKIVSSERVQLSATDFRTELAKIKSSKPDIIFVVHLAKPLGTLIKQARELGLESILLSHSEAEDPNVLEVAGRAAEGFLISSSEPKDKTDTVRGFERRYEIRYGSASDVIAANAYDSFVLQMQAYTVCKGNTACMIQELRNVKDHDGASGKITINPDGSASKPAIFKVVKNGRFVPFAE